MVGEIGRIMYNSFTCA